MTDKPLIAICTPVGRQPTLDFVGSLIQVLTDQRVKDRCTVIWLNVQGHANTPRARNILAHGALRMPDVQSIIWIDDDIGFTVEGFLDLISHDEPLVAGAPQRRTNDPSEGAVFCGYVEPGAEKKGRLRKGYAATAFFRTDRCVYERMQDNTETFTYTTFPGEKVYAYFHYKIEPTPNGEIGYQGEDFYFCQRAYEAGCKVWIDPEIELRHWNNMPLTALMSDVLALQEAAHEIA